MAQTVPPVGVAANALAPSSCPRAYPAGYTTSMAADATLTTWNAQGDKTTVVSPAPAGQAGAQTTTYAYDAASNLLTLSAPAATVSGTTQVTTYTYDAANELLSQTAASETGAASITAYCYDPNGRRSAVVPGDGNTSGLPRFGSAG